MQIAARLIAEWLMHKRAQATEQLDKHNLVLMRPLAAINARIDQYSMVLGSTGQTQSLLASIMLYLCWHAMLSFLCSRVQQQTCYNGHLASSIPPTMHSKLQVAFC